MLLAATLASIARAAPAADAAHTAGRLPRQGVRHHLGVPAARRRGLHAPRARDTRGRAGATTRHPGAPLGRGADAQWINRFRALLVRWDKKTTNYEGSLHLACAYITFARAGLLG
jgi:hypothetical protein